MHAITRSCVLFLWIHTLTFVQCQDCTLEQFLTGPLYDSNFDTTGLDDSYIGGKQVRVSCNVGYSGFFKLVCIEGKWQSRGTKCQPRPCGHPGDAQFADFHLEKGEDFVFGSKVVYTCHKGYHMVSRTNHRNCMAEGWDGVVPVCEAQQCPVIEVGDNVHVNGDLEEATYGNVVRFSCKSNTEIVYGEEEIYCNENGGWSAKAPKCDVIKCNIPIIGNGYVPGDIQEYKEHHVLNFVCNHLYKPAEGRPSKCTKIGDNADWSPTPVCEPIKCRLEEARGTSFEPRFKNVFSPGETVSISCAQKYWISNHQTTSAVTTCNSDGNWDISPQCLEVICDRRDPLVDRWDAYRAQQIKLDQTVRYWCSSGYKRTDGGTRATCTRYGWKPNPLCQEITCAPQDVLNADIENDNSQQQYKHNDQVKYICRDGYKGSPILTCGEDGWIQTSRCTEITCQRKQYWYAEIAGNAKSMYKYNEQVEYNCEDGGHFTLTCGANGWIGSPVCTTCTKPNLPNGFMYGPHNDILYYTCNEDYKPYTKGWWGEAKCKDGVWSGLARCIEKSKCGEIPWIPNREGNPHRNDYGPGDNFNIVCEEGYQAVDGFLTCNEGEWHSNRALETICTPTATHCGPPPKVLNAVLATAYQRKYLSDSAVTYKCRDKYAVEGQATIRCKDGKWEETNINCTPLSCDPPPAVEGVTVKGLPQNEEPILPDHFLTFSCNVPGKSLNGSSGLTCGKDGQWNNPFPSCEDITCKVGVMEPNLDITGLPPADETIEIGHKLQFQCNDPYELDGSAEIECLQTGEWDAPFPTCAGKCKIPRVPANIRITTSAPDSQARKGQKLSFVCNKSGHFLRGNASIECLANGEWSDPVPTCGPAVGCRSPPALANGDIRGSLSSNYRHNQKVEYICQAYYTMKGNPIQTCRNGEWIGQMRCLQPCTVDKALMEERNIGFKFSYMDKIYSVHDDEIEFTCIGRTSHDGVVGMRQRCVDGVMPLPTCQ